LHISAPQLDADIRVLSGGNQQKALFARWISTRTRVLLLEDPTAGMDVSAKQEVYRILQTLSARRVAVLVASSDADALLSLCDRIVVLGREAARSIPVDATTRPILLAAMTDAEAA
jgi:L-arabinose transport system ATP-binding protein